VIKAKYIYEFDFTGFFNTVRIEAVGDTLDKFYVPKYMIAQLINNSSVDVENIMTSKMFELTTTKDPKKTG